MSNEVQITGTNDAGEVEAKVTRGGGQMGQGMRLTTARENPGQQAVDADMQRAIQDPRWKTDPQYRAGITKAMAGALDARKTPQAPQGQPDPAQADDLAKRQAEAERAEADESQRSQEAEQLAEQAEAELAEGAEALGGNIGDEEVADMAANVEALGAALGSVEAAQAAIGALVDGNLESGAIEALVDAVGEEQAEALYNAGEQFIGRAAYTICGELGLTAAEAVEAIEHIDGNANTRGQLYKAALLGNMNPLGHALRSWRNSNR